MADEQTLEERVEALEALVENAYALNFSGAQINELLDFIDKRKLKAGRKIATKITGDIYEGVTDVSYSDYDSRPICIVDLCYVVRDSEYIAVTKTALDVMSANDKITFHTSASIPSNASTIYFRYVIMERT
ncbi:MAG: hypothetical protein IJ723_04255 [Ruminococcus sp.]|nr:hypothetical protein [Ruminococcus sp.]